MGVSWTKEQAQVIHLRNRNILVSAAAGSGKTAVLVERIITRLTVDEPPIDVDQMLVIWLVTQVINYICIISTTPTFVNYFASKSFVKNKKPRNVFYTSQGIFLYSFCSFSMLYLHLCWNVFFFPRPSLRSEKESNRQAHTTNLLKTGTQSVRHHPIPQMESPSHRQSLPYLL